MTILFTKQLGFVVQPALTSKKSKINIKMFDEYKNVK